MTAGIAVAVATAGLLAPAPASAQKGFFFYERAGHGYTASFEINPNEAEVTLVRSTRTGSLAATYEARRQPVLRRNGRFRADFGSFGEITGRYVDSPGKPECDEKPSGEVRGRIRFRGEDGYAAVSSSRAPAYIRSYACNYAAPRPSVAGPRDLVTISACRPGSGPRYFGFVKRGFAQHVALVDDRTRDVTIHRQTMSDAGPRSFTHAFASATATVKPGGLFDGSASLADAMLTGDLTVEFAGLGRRPLTPAAGGLANAEENNIPAECTRR